MTVNTNEPMHETILIVTDGTSSSDCAVEAGFEIAATSGATVHALCAVNTSWWENSRDISGETVEVTSGPGTSGDRPPPDRPIAALRREGKAITDAVVKSGTERGLRITGAVRSGEPSETILAYTAENDIDLVVVGTGGRRSLDRLVFGDVTGRIIANVDVPVLVASGSEEENR